MTPGELNIQDLPRPAPDDEKFMRRALELAKTAWGKTHPNPMVGALIVEDGRIVSEGFHAKDGGPHAERVALDNLSRPPAPGATMYVTLEPCSTPGRTGACCDAIIRSGIRRVVIGAMDPNPAHLGNACKILKSADIEVTAGVLEKECENINLIYNHWIRRETPLIAAKVATTLDGKVATRSGNSRWITGEAARADVHRWRKLFPAIAAGAMTIIQDNPRLTIRIEGEQEESPIRFVFDGLLRSVLSNQLPRVYTDEFREKTIVVTTQHSGLGYVRKLRDAGVQVWIFESPTHQVSFADFRKRCAEEKIPGVYVEGGAFLISRLLRARQLDYLFAYRAPLILADDKAKSVLSGFRPDLLNQAIRMENILHETFAEDSLMRGHVVYPEKLYFDETVFGL